MTRSTLSLMVALAGLLLIAPGCGKRGSGTAVEQTRPAEGFDRIHIDSVVTLNASVGPEFALTVRTDDNLIDKVKTEVVDGVLQVDVDGSIRTELGIVVTVVAPKLIGLSVSGAAKASLTGLTGDTFTLEVSGAAKAALVGTVDTLTMDVSGAAKVDASSCKAATVNLDSSGAAAIDVHADKALNAKVSGAGRVRWSGAGTLSQTISGAARISRK